MCWRLKGRKPTCRSLASQTQQAVQHAPPRGRVLEPLASRVPPPAATCKPRALVRCPLANATASVAPMLPHAVLSSPGKAVMSRGMSSATRVRRASAVICWALLRTLTCEGVGRRMGGRARRMGEGRVCDCVWLDAVGVAGWEWRGACGSETGGWERERTAGSGPSCLHDNGLSPIAEGAMGGLRSKRGARAKGIPHTC